MASMRNLTVLLRMQSVQNLTRKAGLVAMLSLMAGCGGGGGSTNAGAGTGPVGYGTCNIDSNGTPTKCIAYTGSVFQLNVTTASTGCSGTGYTLNTSQSSCSLANSVGTCTIHFGTSTVDATSATTFYSTGGYSSSGAQSNCLAVGGTYTNP